MDFLQQIIEMDKAAAAQTEEVREVQLKKLDISNQNAMKRQEAIIQEQQLLKDEAEIKQAEMLEQKKADSAAELENGIKKLDDVFNAHRMEWQAEIISRITGV